jgi:aspartyl-tRNA(Asn)/glutamyl-tRNA(Gln) amidotransferase subunit A
MRDSDIAYASISELAALLSRREISSEELTGTLIARTEKLEPRLNSYVTFLPEQALAQAKAADREIAAGNYRGVLHGVPVSLKDLFDVAGLPTTGGARFMQDTIVKSDSRVTVRLRDAGSVFMGKSSLNKFAGGESGDNPDFGKIRNPWNTDFSPGGSSGGSAAQLAAGLVALSVGTDNGGSVRMPAALSGIVGLKPTYGRISMEGMFPRAYSLDHAGTLSRTVSDCAIALQILAGHDKGDTTTARKPVPDYSRMLKGDVRGIRIGIDRTFSSVAQPVVHKAFNAALQKLEELGCIIQEVTLPTVEEFVSIFRKVFRPEWGVAHEPWLRTRPEEYPEGWNARTTLLLPAVEYIKASQQRRLIQIAYAKATRNVDFLATPAYPHDFRPFDKHPDIDGKPSGYSEALRYTRPFNLLGLPAISLPCGFSEAGFPIGLQLVGRAFDESGLLKVSYAYEQASEWHKRRPPLDPIE